MDKNFVPPIENKENFEQKYFKEQIGNIKVYFSTWQDVDQTLLDKIEKIKLENSYLDYKNAGQPEKLFNTGILSGEKNSYVISPIDQKGKWSDDYLDCTGVLFTGIKKGTKERFSFITHQDPKFFIENFDNKKNFKDALEKRIDALVRICELGSIDVSLFGGNNTEDQKKEIGDDFISGRHDKGGVIEDYFPTKKNQVYADSVNFLNFIISNKLGFIPTVALGPNDNYNSPNNHYGKEKDSLSAYFDNENSKLILIGPKRTSQDSFMADEVDKLVK